MGSLRLNAAKLPEETEELRTEVRAFLADELDQGSFTVRCDNWLGGIDPAFSRKLGDHGWLGMTWPRSHGGHDRSPLERFVVTEELLAAGAPVAAHWVSDRQVGPNLVRFGSEEQQRAYLPAIARGECFFCIGMSEPDAGSDLASVRTRANRTTGGWIVSGSKVWTSVAHIAHAMMTLVRTSPAGDDRHAGLTQLIVDMSSDGVTVNPIAAMDGKHHFNEVVLQDVFVPDVAIVGQVGDGWRQVTAELAYERSGPERLMSTVPLLLEWCRALRKHGLESSAQAAALGRLVARCWTLRQMSLAVAAALADGRTPTIEAAMVKDLGTQLEREIVEVVRLYGAVEPDPHSDDDLCRMLAEAVLHLPAFTLRGGTTEILRGIVARGLGLR
jgi:acyl-CoA dehydrogenase